jgi:mono/diheme cytochrome c family protein
MGWKRSLGTALIVPAVVGLMASAVQAGQQPAASGEVTFSKDIAPILQRSCQKCHRQDGVAPMSLVTYEEVRPWARSIKTRTSIGPRAGVMPPWYVEKNIGIQKFKNDPSLSEEEIAKIAKWADNGAPRGNPADMPPARTWDDASKWSIGTPDLIVKTTDLEVKANAPDWWGEIPRVPTGLTEDRYVVALQVKEVNDVDAHGSGRATVGGRYVFHHMIWQTRVIDDKGAADVGAFDDDSTGWPVHEVGREADFFDQKSARLLKAGSSIVSDSVHLHSNGRDTKAHLEIGFKFAPKGFVPEYKRSLTALGSQSAAARLRGAERADQDPLVRAAPPRPRRAHVPRGDLGLQHPDAQLRGLRPQLGARLQLRRRLRAAAPEGDDPPHYRLHGQLAVEQERAGSPQLAGIGQPLGGEHVHRSGESRVAHRRAIPGRDGTAA